MCLAFLMKHLPLLKHFQSVSERPDLIAAPPRSLTIPHPNYCSNEIHTTKYTLYSFLPRFLYEQFSEFANMFFLLLTIMQIWPELSPFGQQSTSVPLLVILLFAFCKEVYEDYKRRLNDRIENHRLVTVFMPGTGWETIPWSQAHAGQIVYVKKDEVLPADIILISSSEPGGIAYIETANLDGETNLKVRRSPAKTASAHTHKAVEELLTEAVLIYEQPNRMIYDFTGTLILKDLPLSEAMGGGSTQHSMSMGDSFRVSLDRSQLLQRSAKLQNTDFIFGVIVYAGKETKCQMNSIRTKMKRTRTNQLLNYILMVQFGILTLMSLALSHINKWDPKVNFQRAVFVHEEETSLMVTFCSYVVLLCGFIPISLYVTLQTVQIAQSSLIRSDLDLYDEDTDMHAEVRTTALTPQLGEVSYIMADKTGTLTQNIMLFRNCSVGGVKYGSKRNKIFRAKAMMHDMMQNNRGNAKKLEEFLIACAICHTVIPEKKEKDEIFYHASSPDELALVNFARNAGFIFHTRTPDILQVTERWGYRNCERTFVLLHVIEFDSISKRMGIIVKGAEGRVTLFVKGADTTIMKNLSAQSQTLVPRLESHLGDFARKGMRTLCFACRVISPEEYNAWLPLYTEASTQIVNRQEALREAENKIIRNLELIGASAIEDKLQEAVPETISRFQAAGISVWVLTGDKLETAMNIGYSCRLLANDAPLLVLSSTSFADTESLLRAWIDQLGPVRLQAKMRLSLIVDAQALDYVLQSAHLKIDFIQIALKASAVICCRCTPLQKAAVTKLVKRYACGSVLAIGDGGNDVAMIQEADVGVGIAGKEGMQAAMSADFAVAQFRHLDKLLLVHGTFALFRQGKTILFSLYKNVVETFVLFFFTFTAGNSLMSPVNTTHVLSFNMIYTSLYPLVMGIFDRPLPAQTLSKNPQLYLEYQNAIKGHLTNVALGAWHATVLFFCALAYWGDGVFDSFENKGRSSFLSVFGATIYYSLVWVVNMKALLETNSITIASYLAVFMSLVGFLIITFIQTYGFPVVPLVEAEQLGLLSIMFCWQFMAFTPCVVILSLLPDLLVKIVQRTTKKRLEVELLEKGGPNPKALFVQPLVKIADLVGIKTTMGRNGFAFAQDDGMALPQAQVVRAYNSMEPKQPGSSLPDFQPHSVHSNKKPPQVFNDKTVESSSRSSSHHTTSRNKAFDPPKPATQGAAAAQAPEPNRAQPASGERKSKSSGSENTGPGSVLGSAE